MNMETKGEKSESSNSTLMYGLFGTIVVALIAAIGSYSTGLGAKNAEIYATKTAEAISSSTLTPPMIEVAKFITVTQEVPIEVTRIVEETRIVTVTVEGQSLASQTPMFVEVTREVPIEVTRIVTVTSISTPYPTYTPFPTYTPPLSTLVSTVETPIELTKNGCIASSVLTTYFADNACDNNLETNWQNNFALSTTPVGSWIQVVFRNPKVISKVGLYRKPNTDVGQMKEALLIFELGANVVSQQKIEFRAFDDGEWEYIDLTPVTADSIKMETISVEPQDYRIAVFELSYFGQN